MVIHKKNLFMLVTLDNGWFRYSNGKKWRVRPPNYFCEVDNDNFVPSYEKYPDIVSKIRRIKSFYSGRLNFGILDQNGNGMDIIIANAFTESLGTVPSPLEYEELLTIYNNSMGVDEGDRLDEVIRYINSRKDGRYLERREPGYINPIITPNRVSLGSHHMLISTALNIIKNSNETKTQRIIELCLSLPSRSIKSAQLAIDYLNNNYQKHFNHPPLIAATYNAGSPRYTSTNLWNLVQYGQHIDRWIAYYNTSRKV